MTDNVNHPEHYQLRRNTMAGHIGRDCSKDVHVKEGDTVVTIVYCYGLRAWPLPGHSERFPNTVSTPTKARQMARRICREIERGE